MTKTTIRALAPALALALGLGLAGCATNRSLESVHQPVVGRTNYTLDVATYGGGLSLAEQRRVDGWFEALDLRYGDRVSVDDPSGSAATREAVAALAARHGLLVSDGAPVTPGSVAPGNARVVVTRAVAHVPGCPDWRSKYDANLNNATYSNYGCAVNSNVAAMVANPEDLLRGAQGSGETVVMSSSKAITSYRAAPPTGEKGLKEVSSEGSK